jgi:hypothetical protein
MALALLERSAAEWEYQSLGLLWFSQLLLIRLRANIGLRRAAYAIKYGFR